MDPGDSRLVNSRAVRDGRINDVFYPGGMRQGRHRHDSASFSFIATGRYEERVGRRAHSREMFTLVFHPAGEKHSVKFESDVRIFSVEFRNTNGPGSPAESLSESCTRRGELVAWLGLRLGREITRADSASALAIDGLIAELVAEDSRGRVLSGGNGFASWLPRAVEFVHDNFKSTLSLEEVAGVAGVHTAHLSRVFRQKMGCTVGEYLRRLRFEFACQQILSTRKPLCEVAYEAGFADQSHFNRIFGCKMGITPYEYRKLHGEPPSDARFVQDFRYQR